MAIKVTIKDVARLSGVSIGTVDRVLHGRGRVSKEKETAVLQAASALNYTPSQIARALVRQKNNITIGISVFDYHHEFWNESLSGIQYAKNSLEPFGVEVVLDQCMVHGSEGQKASIERLLEKGVNGILFTPFEESIEWVDRVIPKEIPYATVIDDIPADHRLFHIGPDDYALGEALAKLSILYAKDNVQAVILAPNANVHGTKQRIAGFVAKMKSSINGNELLEVVNISETLEEKTYDEIYTATLRALDTHPTLNTIYVTNGLPHWAAAAIKAVNPSRKIYVFGHEYTELIETFIKGGDITATIYQKPAQQWNLAIHTLNDYLMGEKNLPFEIQVTECSILMAETLPFTDFGRATPL